MSRLSKRLGDDLAAFASQLQQKQHVEMLKKVCMALSEDLQLLECISALIDSGCLEARLNPACTKWHRSAIRYSDLSVASLLWLLGEIDDKADRVKLKHAAENKKKMGEILEGTLNIRMNEKLCSKVKTDTVAMLRVRHTSFGGRLSKLQFTEDNKVDWPHSGIYHIDRDAKTIKHCCGSEASIPSAVNIGEGLEVQHNWSEDHASLNLGSGITLKLKGCFTGLPSLVPLPAAAALPAIEDAPPSQPAEDAPPSTAGSVSSSSSSTGGKRKLGIVNLKVRTPKKVKGADV